ncbi:hypothetical protein C2L65_35300 [Paraburkholderia terrae]|uniref:Phage tail lysozyme domain-containing protein n=1 Tax=Paraburkholderia terrae TaxID=311230 RepID=A0A2I8EZH0_9BURK|nr:hypothetical protein C2L65_35300 [Paraburkholderia terrae]
MLLTAGHTVLSTTARQGDLISALQFPQTPLGVLLTWTALDGDVTVDAALIWVDPACVSADILGIGLPSIQASLQPQVGDAVRIFSSTSSPRQMTIDSVLQDVPILAHGPDWSAAITYRGQILCSPGISHPGDSGAVAVDAQNRVLGMVVAGSEDTGITVVTPISAILQNSAWHGGELEILDSVPPGSTVPPFAQSQRERDPAVDLSSLPPPKQLVAQTIIDAFANAGFGVIQQVAALANAVAESDLQTTARSHPPEDSVGLFQLNRTGGAGKGYTVAQLQDPGTNIGIAIDAMSKIRAFRSASFLDDAVAVFVRAFERPQNAELEISRRQKIARTFCSNAD